MTFKRRMIFIRKCRNHVRTFSTKLKSGAQTLMTKLKSGAQTLMTKLKNKVQTFLTKLKNYVLKCKARIEAQKAVREIKHLMKKKIKEMPSIESFVLCYNWREKRCLRVNFLTPMRTYDIEILQLPKDLSFEEVQRYIDTKLKKDGFSIYSDVLDFGKIVLKLES